MNIRRPSPALRRAGSSILLCIFCCCALILTSCVDAKRTKPDPGRLTPPNSAEKQLAYGASLYLPPSYTVAGNAPPASSDKASLDGRRRNGERILLLEAAAPPSSRGIEPMIAVFLVNQQGTFMPREFAEKITPEELATVSKELLDREKSESKKKKAASSLLDLQISRDTVDGKPAIVQRMLVAGPDGKPARLINWDIYLADGAGIAVKSVCDQEVPGVEAEVSNIVRSLRIK